MLCVLYLNLEIASSQLGAGPGGASRNDVFL